MDTKSIAEKARSMFSGLSKTQRRISIGVGALILACALCMCASSIGAALSGNTATANQASTGQQQTTPQATNTPAKPATTNTPVQPPALGGTVADFTAKYGDPRQCVQEQCYDVVGKDGTPLSGFTATIMVATADNGRIDSITITPSNGAKWTTTTAEAFALVYLPSDAKYLKSHTNSDGDYEMVYKSATIAKQLPSDLYVNTDTGANVAVGTFSVITANGQLQYFTGM